VLESIVEDQETLAEKEGKGEEVSEELSSRSCSLERNLQVRALGAKSYPCAGIGGGRGDGHGWLCFFRWMMVGGRKGMESIPSPHRER